MALLALSDPAPERRHACGGDRDDPSDRVGWDDVDRLRDRRHELDRNDERDRRNGDPWERTFLAPGLPRSARIRALDEHEEQLSRDEARQCDAAGSAVRASPLTDAGLAGQTRARRAQTMSAKGVTV